MRRFLVLLVLSLGLVGLAGWSWWRATEDTRTAILEVRTIPRGATVLYEGRPVDEGELAGLQPGEGEVVARLKGYQEVHQRVRLEAGKRTLARLELSPKPGELALRVKGPETYRVRVGPDPERKYASGDALKLAPGRWRVEVEADGYSSRAKWVEIPSGGKAELALSLPSREAAPQPKPRPTPPEPVSRPAPPPHRPYSPPVYQPPPPPVYYPPPPPTYRPPPPPPPAPAVILTPVPLDPGPEPVFTPIP